MLFVNADAPPRAQLRVLESLVSTMQRLCVRLHSSCGAGAQMIHITCRVLQRLFMSCCQVTHMVRLTLLRMQIGWKRFAVLFMRTCSKLRRLAVCGALSTLGRRTPNAFCYVPALVPCAGCRIENDGPGASQRCHVPVGLADSGPPVPHRCHTVQKLYGLTATVRKL